MVPSLERIGLHFVNECPTNKRIDVLIVIRLFVPPFVDSKLRDQVQPILNHLLIPNRNDFDSTTADRVGYPTRPRSEETASDGQQSRLQLLFPQSDDVRLQHQAVGKQACSYSRTANSERNRICPRISSALRVSSSRTVRRNSSPTSNKSETTIP